MTCGVWHNLYNTVHSSEVLTVALNVLLGMKWMGFLPWRLYHTIMIMNLRNTERQCRSPSLPAHRRSMYRDYLGLGNVISVSLRKLDAEAGFPFYVDDNIYGTTVPANAIVPLLSFALFES